MKSFYLTFLLILFQTLTAIRSEQQIQCNANSLIRADGNVAKILTLGQSDRKFPESEHQAIKYCQ